jgi:hypothetical protein
VRAIGGTEDILLVGTQSGDLYALHAPRTCAAKNAAKWSPTQPGAARRRPI